MSTTPHADRPPDDDEGHRDGAPPMDAYTYIRTHLCPDLDEHPEAREWADRVLQNMKRDYPGGMECGSASSTSQP